MVLTSTHSVAKRLLSVLALALAVTLPLAPVDASLKAIESKVRSGAEMVLYSVNAITSGSTESQGEVTVRLQHGGRVVNGVGADPDIVIASAKAYLSALNKLHSKVERVAAQG